MAKQDPKAPIQIVSSEEQKMLLNSVNETLRVLTFALATETKADLQSLANLLEMYSKRGDGMEPIARSMLADLAYSMRTAPGQGK